MSVFEGGSEKIRSKLAILIGDIILLGLLLSLGVFVGSLIICFGGSIYWEIVYGWTPEHPFTFDTWAVFIGGSFMVMIFFTLLVVVLPEMLVDL